MTPEQTVIHLRERGVVLSRNGGRLHVDAPRGVVTPDLRELLSAHKADLLAVLPTTTPPVTREDRDATEPTYHGYTLADLQAAAHPDEWGEIKDRREVLEVFARCLLESRAIDAGVAP